MRGGDSGKSGVLSEVRRYPGSKSVKAGSDEVPQLSFRSNRENINRKEGRLCGPARHPGARFQEHKEQLQVQRLR